MCEREGGRFGREVVQSVGSREKSFREISVRERLFPEIGRFQR